VIEPVNLEDVEELTSSLMRNLKSEKRRYLVMAVLLGGLVSIFMNLFLTALTSTIGFDVLPQFWQRGLIAAGAFVVIWFIQLHRFKERFRESIVIAKRSASDLGIPWRI